MLHTTRAIVLRTIRHGDRTTILKAYTETSGLRSCIVHMSRRRGMVPSLLEPLSRLEVVMDEQSGRDLNTVKEARIEAPLMARGDPMRSTLLLFTQEVLLRVLKEESADPELFGFLHDAIGDIDTRADLTHFPLVFLLQLARPLGFFPSAPAMGEENFDLREGHFVRGEAPSGNTLRPPLSTALAALLEVDLAASGSIALPGAQRRDLLDHLLLFYRMHVEGMGELRSPEILRQVLT